MKKLLATALVIASAAGIGYVVYRDVLSEEARENVQRMVETARDSYERIHEVIASVRGDVMTDDGLLPNVQVTMRQWRDLGY